MRFGFLETAQGAGSNRGYRRRSNGLGNAQTTDRLGFNNREKTGQGCFTEAGEHGLAGILNIVNLFAQGLGQFPKPQRYRIGQMDKCPVEVGIRLVVVSFGDVQLLNACEQPGGNSFFASRPLWNRCFRIWYIRDCLVK